MSAPLIVVSVCIGHEALCFCGPGFTGGGTAMEFDLLKVFADHPGKALSRDRILTLTKNREWDPYDRSIDIRIARLRRKIEADPERPVVIRTVRGVGYMFVPARFDAVITDQCMPRLNGLQLARALRAVRPELPVILYSGHGEGLGRTDLEAAGVRTVLRKPVDPAALEAALRGALRCALATKTPAG
jgi:DNA-binding response OmpR family regulator